MGIISLKQYPRFHDVVFFSVYARWILSEISLIIGEFKREIPNDGSEKSFIVPNFLSNGNLEKIYRLSQLFH